MRRSMHSDIRSSFIYAFGVARVAREDKYRSQTVIRLEENSFFSIVRTESEARVAAETGTEAIV